jgi:predicted  nucleic acid-binding Zn-ribbon protein
MLPIVEQLLVIQDRDCRITQLKAEQARIPSEIAAVDKRVQEESARLESARQELKHIETERKKLEIDAESRRAQIVRYKTQLSQIKSNTEYQALLKEITRTEEEITRVEDVELELMEKSERLQPALKQTQGGLKEMTVKAEAEKADLQKRASLIAQELTQLREERKKLAEQIDPDALARYERLIRSKGDVAVVPVQHRNCGGCHLQLALQIIHNAKDGTELTSCDYCGRILYWQGE